MPIPKPNPGEGEKDFIPRCMADKGMNSEYPDAKQRAAVCHQQLRDRSKMDKDNTIWEELFSVGLWNGRHYILDDLHDIANNFKHFKDLLKPMLKLGHEEGQEEEILKYGQPALGWIEDIRVDEKLGKLFGKFTDIPAIVKEALQKKLYKQKSIEIDIDVEHDGETFEHVLTGVALLGADLPAVNNLNDLKAYMSRSTLRAAKRICFTVNSETKDMSEDIKKYTDEIADLKAKNAKLVADKKAYDKREADRLEAERKSKIQLARKTVTDKLEQAVKDHQILPAQRDTFSRMLGVSDDERVVTIKMEDVDSMIKAMGGSSTERFTQETSYDDNTGDDPNQQMAEPDEEIHRLTEEYRAEHPAVPYDRAAQIVMRRNKNLAKRWVFQNDRRH